MLWEAGTALGVLLYKQVSESMNIDEQATKKNVKAFTKTADGQRKLKKCQEEVWDKLSVNAKRKNGILTCHLKMFQEQYKVIRQIQFKKGRGIEELEKMDEIQKKVNQYVTLPCVATGKIMTDPQLLVSLVLKGGIGGLMIADSKDNLKLSRRNMAMADAAAAQIDSVCIALNGIARHIEIMNELLEKLGMLYMKSVRNITAVLEKNGIDESNYSDQDIDAINTALIMTKLIYRIINTPVIDEDGMIEKESSNVVKEGQKLLESLESV